MLEKLQNMKLGKRLDFGYAVVITMMIISGVFSLIGAFVLYGNMNSYINKAQRADTAVKNCRIDINIAARNVREMALNNDASMNEQYKATVQEKMDDIGVQLEALEATGVIDDATYLEFENQMTDWGAVAFQIMNEIEAGNADEAQRQIFEQCVPALSGVVETVEQMDEATDHAKANSIMFCTIGLIVVVVVIVLFIVIAVILSKRIGKAIITSITTPVHEVELVAQELSNGNLHSQLEYRSDDEIGYLAHSLRKSIRILGSYVDDISRAMQLFSDGNFDVQPEVDWKGDFTGILDSFMKFEGSMAGMVRNIQKVAGQVTSGSGQLAASSMDLAEGATEQAGITEELTATVESISERIAQNAENAKGISREVSDIGSEIVNSDEKMQKMVEAMGEINDASQQISKIIATINDIASQTNLLALNASIEAARAGEAGKGFSVVADQVSMLAAQSAEAAKESTALIESSVQAVEKGILIADETAQQLQHVMESSKVVISDVNDVADALAAQAEAFNQINVGVDRINGVVQTNSATSQQCAAASQEMSGQAEELENLVKSFTIAEM